MKFSKRPARYNYSFPPKRQRSVFRAPRRSIIPVWRRPGHSGLRYRFGLLAAQKRRTAAVAKPCVSLALHRVFGNPFFLTLLSKQPLPHPSNLVLLPALHLNAITMSRYFYFILFLFFSGIASAQEDGGSGSKWCRDDIEKKAVSLYEKGTDKKKYKKPERLEFLVGALKINPEFPEANLAMGLELAARCKLENKAFTPTLPFFYKAIAQCPNIHSEPYYYIGYDFYERMANDSAIK